MAKEINPSGPESEEIQVPRQTGPVVLTLSRTLPGCKRTRTLIMQGAVGIKPEPLHEMDSVVRAIAQVRGIHPRR